MLLGACSSSTVVDRSGPMLADTLTGSQQVAAVVVGTSSILVTYQEAAGTRTVQLASESTSTSTVHFPSAAATVFDASTISEVAKKLATSCTDPDQVTEAFAVSSTATSITTT
jgi:gamma-glutamyl-gamma-aminobutyrate hydrolase PuuD